ncbi:MAG: hypothetical protein ACLP5V_03895 [Candidatus Bathyarchaeia archaeon]
MTGTQIKLDLDGLHSPASLLRFVRANWWFPICFEWPEFGELDVRKVEVRKTMRGYHVVLFVRNRIPSLYLVIVQLCLNSDSKRECVNLRRIVELKLKIWNILYRDKMSVRGFTGHEKRPDKRTAKKIMGQIKDWNLWKKRGLQPF